MTTSTVPTATDRPATAAAEPLAPLHDEHVELLPHIDHLRELADAVGDGAVADLRDGVVAVVGFLRGQLLPHAGAEDAVLYPEVDRVLGGVPATATMRRDHVEVETLTRRLTELAGRIGDCLDPTLARELRQVLYGLHAVVRLHFAKEEEVYVPLLERELTAAQATSLIERLAETTAALGGRAHHH
jgi:iron-sulfur cluster repair protein YtfE (RIC family)